jgi:serine/threonine protein kinase
MPSPKTRRREKSLNRGPRRRITNRRERSLEPIKNLKKHNNAEKIGEGGFGIVSRPPAKCASTIFNDSGIYNINNVINKQKYIGNPNYISKLSESDSARKEYKIGRIVKNNVRYWKDYYCFTEFICSAPYEKHIRVGIDDYQDTYGIAPYCGVTLKSVLEDKHYISPLESCCLMEALKQLAIGLGELHRIQIYHQDIHDENVLFNLKDRKLRWIDFGLAEDLLDTKKAAGNAWEYDPIIVTARIEDTEDLIFSIIKPTLEFVRYKIRQTNISNLSNSLKSRLQDCFDLATYYLDRLPNKLDNHIMPNKYNHFNRYFDKLKKIEKKYVTYVEDFIEAYDENKQCTYIYKNRNVNNYNNNN